MMHTCSVCYCSHANKQTGAVGAEKERAEKGGRSNVCCVNLTLANPSARVRCHSVVSTHND